MSEEKRETLGERLRRLRERIGLGQEELAARARALLVSYRNWEYGHRVPGLAAASLLAKALGVPLQELADCVEGVGDGRSRPRRGRGEGPADGEVGEGKAEGGRETGGPKVRKRGRVKVGLQSGESKPMSPTMGDAGKGSHTKRSSRVEPPAGQGEMQG